MISHDGKCSAKKTYQTHQGTFKPLHRPPALLHLDPLHKYIGLPHNLHADIGTNPLHQLHQPQTADDTAVRILFPKMMHFQRLKLCRRNRIRTAQSPQIRQKHILGSNLHIPVTF